MNAGLIALWGGLLVAGLALFPPLLPATSLVLVVIAWRQVTQLHAKHVAIGMSLGFLGDLCMGVGFVLGGLGFFGAGHVCYIRAIRGIGARRTRRLVAWGVLFTVGLAIWYVVPYQGSLTAPPKLRTIAYLALPYTLLLASTAGNAVGLALVDRRYAWLAVGALLFLASDAVIGLRMFQNEIFQTIPELIRTRLVWATYAPAQLLIVASARIHLELGGELDQGLRVR